MIWNTATHCLQQTLHGNPGMFVDLEFSHDGKSMISFSRTGADIVAIWDIATGILHTQQTLDSQKKAVFNPKLSPNKRELISAHFGLKVWDVATGAIKRTLEENRDVSDYVIAFSPDGSTLATASPNRPVRLWDMATGAVTQTALPELNSSDSLKFSSNGQILAVAREAEGIVILWDISKQQNSPPHPSTGTSTTSHLASQPNGQLLASVSEKRTIQLWNMAKCTIELTVRVNSEVKCIELSPRAVF
ncbi:unnamed protein product [Penicillium pancosmium]